MALNLIVATQKSLLILVFIGIMSWSLCCAQDSPSNEPPNEDTSGEIYLHDEDGETFAVPRLEYQQFLDILQKQVQALQAPETFVRLKSVEVNGHTVRGFAEVDITLVAEIQQDFVSPIKIPIRLSKLIVSESESSGALQSFVTLPSPASSLDQGNANETSASDDEALTDQDQLVWEIRPPADSIATDTSGSKKECRISLHGYLPIADMSTTQDVNQSSPKSQIEFDLPEVPSVLHIKLPNSFRDVSWTDEINRITDEKEDSESTEWKREGIGGLIHLSWSQTRNVEQKIATEVTSSTRMQVNMDGRPWSATSRISLKPSAIVPGRPITVQFPSGGVWSKTPDSTSAATWKIVPIPDANSTDSANSSESSERPVTRLQLTPPNDEPARSNSSAEIKWTWQPPARLDQDFKLQTITVQDADRHEGTLELVLPSQIQFNWLSGENGVLSRRLIESGTPDLFNYVFSFSKTPLDVVCRLRESGYRLQYRPEYFAELKEDSIELTGFLNFAVDPSLMVGLEINLGPWTVKDIRWAQSGQPIDFEQSDQGVVRFDPAGLYRRNDPTLSAASSTGRTIQATLVRALASNAGSPPVAQIDLPTVAWLNDQGQAIVEVGNGWLVVATNEWLVEKPSVALQALTPIEEIPTNLSNFIKPSEKNQRLAYLFSPQEKTPVWKAELKRKPNLATQSVDIRVDFDQASYRVQKTWTVGQNKWSDLSFLLCVPESVAGDLLNDNPDVPAAQRSSLTLDGKRVPCQRLPLQGTLPLGTYVVEAASAENKQNAPANPNLTTINVPTGWATIQPILGEVPRDFVLKLEATAEVAKSDSDANIPPNGVQAEVALPFLISSSPILPIERRFEAHVNNTWKVNLQADGNTITVLPGQTIQSKEFSGTLTNIHTTLEKLSIVKPSTVRINQIWLQTALNGAERRDRCVIDLSTAAEQLELNLANADLNNLTSVLINGQRVDPQRIEGTSSLILPLPRPAAASSGKKVTDTAASSKKPGEIQIPPNSKAAPAPSRFTVELWIWSTVSQQLVYRIDENLPRIANTADPAPRYWQVVVPQHDHLWSASDSLIPEYQWKWSGLTLQRTTQMQQPDLERLTRASEQAQFGLDANRYLFSSLATRVDGNTRAPVQYVYVVPRFVLFGPVGLIAVLAACLLVYFPSLRSIWMVGLAAVMSLALAAISIDLAILLAQALAGSLIVVAILLIVQWSINRRVGQRSVFANRSRVSSRATTPVAQVDFGSGEFSSHSDQAGHAMSKKSNSAFGTTRSIQNGASSDQDAPVGKSANQSVSDESAVEEATK